MKENKSTLKQFMSSAHRNKLGEWPTTHRNCIDLFGIARPGKTARDKANGHIPYQPNRRFPDKGNGKR